MCKKLKPNSYRIMFSGLIKMLLIRIYDVKDLHTSPKIKLRLMNDF